MARELCNYFNCEKKYQCLTYCTPVENGQEKIDFSDKCNINNGYPLYRDWRKGKGKEEN